VIPREAKKEICDMLIETINEIKDSNDWSIEGCNMSIDIRELPSKDGIWANYGWFGGKTITIRAFSESAYQQYILDCYESVAELD